MVLAMHAGFAFLELGTVRRKSQVNALVKILTDFAVSTIAYFFIGYAVAYGIHFFTGADKNCTYEHFNWGGGKIDLKLVCKHEQATTTMAMAGTYTPDNYELTMTSTNNAAGAAGDMTMTMKVDAKRVGDCDSKDKAGG